MPDFYPSRESELVQWHATFAAALSSYSAVLGIAAPVVTQVTLDAANVGMCLTAVETAKNYLSEVVAFKDQMLKGLLNTPTPPAPTQPGLIVLAMGSLGNIEARTRQLVAQIKANPAYTQQIGEDMGIIATSGTGSGPSIASATAQPAQKVDIRITFGGAPAAVLFRSVDGGPWVQATVMTAATYQDTVTPGAPGQAAVVSYRVQAYVNNTPSGPYSDVVQVTTIP